MADWRDQWPPVAVSRRIIGDDVYAYQFMGLANALLWQVKNAMKFNNLRQNWGFRVFQDGTTIQAKSIFGHDIIEIDVSKATFPLLGGCSITFIGVPNVVQPMRHPQHIHKRGDLSDAFTEGSHPGARWDPDDILGVDYIKTYYQFNPPINVDITWLPCKSSDINFGFGEGAECAAFIYKTPSEPYYQGAKATEAPFTDIPPNPINHCIFSFSGCNGEILETGSDGGGNYIIWKAYTEWSNVDLTVVDFSRTGLGYMKLRASIKNPDGSDLCFAEKIVRVDCCQKSRDQRVVDIYWNFIDGWPWNCMNQPWFFWGDGQWCEVPDKLDFWYLARVAVWYEVNWTTMPELKGSCIPFKWTLEGPGTITPWGDGLQWVNWKLPKDFSFEHPTAAEACRDVIITGEDRCGNKKTIVANCCDHESGPTEILYTTLLMTFGEQQTLIGGGCPPNTWTATSGTFVGPTDMGEVVFQADSSNVDCAHHPLITVTDCCGRSARLQLYVTSGAYQTTLEQADTIIDHCESYPFSSSGCINNCFQNQTCVVLQYFRNRIWDCSGNLISDCNTGGAYYDCELGCNEPGCTDTPPRSGCWSNQCGGPVPCVPCGTLADERDQAAKDAGCCPMNPFTGLPM
jgi:hypothetical protein